MNPVHRSVGLPHPGWHLTLDPGLRRRWQRMYEEECRRCEEARVLADSMAADSLRAKGFIEAEVGS